MSAATDAVLGAGGAGSPRPLPPTVGRGLTGALADRMRLGAEFYGDLARRHGDVVPFRIGRWRAVLLSHPDAIAHVLRQRPHGFSKGDVFDTLRVLLGDGLLVSHGDAWRRQRRIVQPAFHPTRIAGIVPAVHRWVARLGQDLDRDAGSGQPVDLHAHMTRLTLDIAAETLFGAALDPAVVARIGALTESLASLLERRLFSAVPVPTWVPTPLNLRIRQVIVELDRTVYAIIDARVTAPGPDSAPDLLGALLAARDADGAPLSREELRGQVMTFFMAGHETTASALSWCWHLLGAHPDAAARVRAEADLALPADGSLPAGADDVARLLPEACAVIHEALRLYPPGWTLTRRGLGDEVIAGYAVPAGTDLLICPYALHRDPRFWPDPAAFRPERFTAGPLDPRTRAAFLPFGAGPRACIGGAFAMTEAALVLAWLSQRYTFTPAPGASVTVAPLISLRPSPGVFATVRARHRDGAQRSG